MSQPRRGQPEVPDGEVPDHLRLLPHDLDAEDAVLGACLISATASEKAAEMLTQSDFYHRGNGRVFAAVLSLLARQVPADFLTVEAELKRTGGLESAGGRARLIALTETTPAAAHVEHYARILQEKATLRALVEEAQETIVAATAPDAEAAVVVDRAQERILAVNTRRAKEIQSHPAGIVMAEALEALDPEKPAEPSLKTGFRKLDGALFGLRPGTLVLVAARPGIGKTGFVLRLARNVAAAGQPVQFFSLEMPRHDLSQRLIAAEMGIDMLRLAQRRWEGDEYMQAVDRARDFTAWPLNICDDCELSAMAIRSHARRTARDQGTALIIVDHLQEIPLPERSENANLGYTQIVRQLRVMARTLRVPVILVCQLSREVERRTDKRPLLSDLRDTGSLEQYADACLMLYRGSYYTPNEQMQDPVEILIRKNRQGPTGAVTVWYDRKTQRFTDVDEWREDEAPPEPAGARQYHAPPLELNSEEGWTA